MRASREAAVVPTPPSVLFIILLLVSANLQAAISASVDRSRINAGDSLTLTITADAGEDLAGLDLTELKRLFTVAASSESTRFSFGNGNNSRISSRELTLLPRREGVLEIPSLGQGRAGTAPLRITVAPASHAIDAERELFVEVELDRDETYVQSQVLYTFRLYHAIALEGQLGLTPLSIPDAVIEPLEQQSYQRLLDGRRFTVRELRYAIFPQKSGLFDIPSLTLSARARPPRRSFFDRNQGRLMTRQTPALRLEVLPVPAHYPDAPWLPLTDLAISEDWSRPPTRLALGDSVTRTITLSAEGLPAKQLPALPLRAPQGIKLYPDKPRRETGETDSGVRGVGINSAALLITEAGSHELPAIRIPWWDTAQGELRFAELPAQRLNILAANIPVPVDTPAVASTQTAAMAKLPTPTSIWVWVSAILAGGWLLTLLAWYRQRQSTPATTAQQPKVRESESRLYRSLRAAQTPQSTRQLLRCWGQLRFNIHPQPALAELARRINDADVAWEIRALESCLYRDHSQTWTAEALLRALDHWRSGHPVTDAIEQRQPLPPLNPNIAPVRHQIHVL